MLFGCNAHHYPEVAADVSGVSVLRVYNDGQRPLVPDGMRMLLSIRPDPALLLAGKLDIDLIPWLADLPGGTLLTCWHEPNVNTAAQPGIKPVTARRIHRHMRDLVRAHAPHVTYGLIVLQDTTWRTGLYCAVWGLGFYGLDVYDFAGLAPAKIMARCFRAMPPGRRLVAETNTSHPGKRPEWFAGVYGWLAAHHGLAMVTFWKPDGPLSGPWLPDDAATVKMLNVISAAAPTGKRLAGSR